MSKKKSNLNKAIEALNKTEEIAFTGKEGASKLAIEALSTGIPKLDFEIGVGGLPKGRISEVFGMPSSTKTSLCLFIIGNAQKQGVPCAYIDAEYALDLKHARAMGVDTDDLLIVQPNSGDEAFTAIETLLREDAAKLIVIDSVSALVPRGDVEAEMGMSQMGSQARLISYSLRKLVNPISKSGAVVLFINQLRVNIMGGQWDPWTRPGGQALRFYTSLSIELKKTEALKKGDDLLGYTVNFIIRKNKVGVPNGKGELEYFFDRGFVGEADILEMGERAGLIRVEGITYYKGDQKLAAGRDKAREAILSNPSLLSSLSEELGLSQSQ